LSKTNQIQNIHREELSYQACNLWR